MNLFGRNRGLLFAIGFLLILLSTVPFLTAQDTRQQITIELTARNFRFSEKSLAVPAGARVTIQFINRDSGIPHNFSLYTDSSAETPVFKGQVISGGERVEYSFTAPDRPGEYYFRCDIHPIQMNGKLTVR